MYVTTELPNSKRHEDPIDAVSAAREGGGESFSRRKGVKIVPIC